MALVYLGLGSNIEREKHILSGIIELAEHFDWECRSRVFESRAVGFAGSNFYNLVAAVRTELDVDEVWRRCKQIEYDHGRSEHSPKFSPRTLDIDILLYDDMIRREHPQLPRAEILENAFVLWPLADIAAQLKHPTEGVTYKRLWEHYDCTQELAPIEDERWLPF